MSRPEPPAEPAEPPEPAGQAGQAGQAAAGGPTEKSAAVEEPTAAEKSTAVEEPTAAKEPTATEEPTAAEIPAGEGKRLHPLTPWRRAWAPLAGLFAVALQNAAEVRDQARGAGLGWLVLAVVVLVLGATAYGYLSWRVTRYQVTATELRIRTGLLFRRTAHLRLDRIQAIDISRPLLARAFGVAKLKMDVVGSGSSDELAFLDEDEATELRAELLARAAGIAPEAASSAGEAPAHQLHQVDSRTLGWSLALLGSGWGALLAGLLVTPLIWLVTDSFFPALVVLLPLLASIWRGSLGAFLTQYGWTVSESPDGLRLDHGLLQRDHATVPPGRVQAVRIVEPLLWRPRGWLRVELDVAGEGNEGGLLLPVATRETARELLARILPEVRLDEALASVRTAPQQARWAVPVWRVGYGHGVTDAVFVARHGRLRRVHTLVPHAKVQSVRLTQGPWERRLGLATIRVDHGANGTAAARLQPAGYVAEEVARQARRSRLGRRTAAPDRWLTARRAGGGSAETP
ncbi:PH domain-containing protein [Streptomyces sp. DSM 44915]|uniref:PH domain-containing protein n=1 Tax=Streptomyces chisholmiae TaxID=3075540 RepID=A0ABU2JX55_9ACTN|nr:PH domain-containing protein [Streptomyces sp. DSM 44915]MDT0269540.1 PH domain-containing protein [Streptomyces sp. DSM 44915]